MCMFFVILGVEVIVGIVLFVCCVGCVVVGGGCVGGYVIDVMVFLVCRMVWGVYCF